MERRSFFLKEGMSQSIYGPILPVLQMGPPSRELWPVGSRLARSRRDERALPPPAPRGRTRVGQESGSFPPRLAVSACTPPRGAEVMHTYGPQGMQSAAPRAQVGARPWNPSQVDDEGANGHLNRQESQRITLPGRTRR